MEVLKRNSNKLQLLIIHCSDTVEGRYYDKKDIISWHTTPVDKGGRGWKRVGYSDLILIDGTLENLIKYDYNDTIDNWEITNGATGFNNIARHICYIGGKDINGNVKDTRTKEQLYTLETYIRYMLLKHKDIRIGGHNQFSDKKCPSFNVPLWCEEIGIPSKNIYL